MLFNSLIFLGIFLPICWGVFALLRGRRLFQISVCWLIVCSLVFYGYWNPPYLILILGSIAVNYAFGHAQNLLHDQGKQSRPLMAGAVLFNLGLLGYYKYAGFITENINALSASALPVPDIILPLAISFFTFQQIAYQVDAYRGEAKEHGFLDYVLFVTFFPQLVAGPIVHHKEMMPQFRAQRTLGINPDHLALGLVLFSCGLFKKVVLADNLARYATPVFDAANGDVPLTLFESWGGVLAYSFQIYFDFSGYSDMALGLAALFGIMLPFNFLSPYRAGNIIDFWRRWHITLSRFLRDYLYIPLGGNRKGKLRRYNNLLMTMLIGGIWHGAGWTFVIWGGLHGVYLIINHAWHRVLKGARITHPIYKLAAWALTFTAVSFAWVFFRAESADAAFNICRALIGQNGAVLDYRLESILPFMADFIRFEGTGIGAFPSVYGVLWLGAAAGIAWLCPNIYSMLAVKTDQDSLLVNNLAALPKGRRTLLLAFMALLLVVALGQIGAPSEFLYFDF